MLHFQPLVTQHQQREYLRQHGFTAEQISRFVAYRAFYQTGFYQGEPDAYRRLRFARWLYLQGKISREVSRKALHDEAVSKGVKMRHRTCKPFSLYGARHNTAVDRGASMRGAVPPHPVVSTCSEERKEASRWKRPMPCLLGGLMSP
jgi:hypothetical protein